MQTEDEESITQCKIMFQKRQRNSSFAVSVSPVQIMTSSTILQNSACLSFRQIQQTNIHYTSLQSVRSATQWDCSYRPSLVPVYIENICFPRYVTTLFCTVRQRIIIPDGWHNVARCSRHRKSLPRLLLWKNSSSWRLSRCHNVADLSVLTVW